MFRYVQTPPIRNALFIGGAALSAEARAQEDKAAESSADLPLKRVVMFSSGVAFYDHSGQVDGDARVDFKFNVDDVNDLLKSMVVQDTGGGRIAAVNYGSKEPITKTLKTFAIDLTSNPTLADLLNQVRGERVRIDAPNEIVGVILGVERRKQRVDKDHLIDVDLLNLLTEEGLRSVPLESVSRIKLLNDALDKELRQALSVLAMGHSTDEKTVSLRCVGRGQRDVRVGYIQEAPIWKTSYRLELGDKGPPKIQGWAIVENTTEKDWKDVDLTLVSGRPISFVMDLYDPLYVSRPVVEPELFASLRPQTYGQDLAEAGELFRKKAAGQNAARDEMAANGRALADRRNRYAAPAAAKPSVRQSGKSLDFQQGVRSVAQAGDVGELFRYRIDTPVTLPRRQSAMLPIVNGSVEGEKVSIYNANVQAKHPLNGLKLTNTTGLHLMQGPITVFDGGVYAGDARIQDLQPGAKRLVSYALDLDTEVAAESRPKPQELSSLSINRGVLYASRKYRRATNYTVKNSGDRAKKVLIEYPLETNWKLTEPDKPEEKTRDMYRFAVEAKPGEPAKLTVAEERIEVQRTALTNLSNNDILIYVRSPVVSDKVKTALQEVVRRKQDLAELANHRKRLEQQIKVIDTEQDRIRRNMQELDRKSDLYNRYVKKFTEQEDTIEDLRKQISKLQDEEAKQQKALNDYLSALTLS